MQDITIRNASLADAPRILEIYAWYVEHTVITFEYDVPSLEEFEGRMRRTMQKYPYLVIERDGRVEGYAYAGPFVGRAAYDWACELTIYLDHDARKHGMGRALYEALADRLQLSSGATSAMVEVLVRKRLLERTPCPLDRRAVRIRTTDTCRRLVAEGCRYFTERTVAFLEALPETERSSLLEVLKEFHRSISTHQLETEIR